MREYDNGCTHEINVHRAQLGHLQSGKDDTADTAQTPHFQANKEPRCWLGRGTQYNDINASGQQAQELA